MLLHYTIRAGSQYDTSMIIPGELLWLSSLSTLFTKERTRSTDWEKETCKLFLHYTIRAGSQYDTRMIVPSELLLASSAMS